MLRAGGFFEWRASDQSYEALENLGEQHEEEPEVYERLDDENRIRDPTGRRIPNRNLKHGRINCCLRQTRKRITEAYHWTEDDEKDRGDDASDAKYEAHDTHVRTLPPR